MVTAIDYAVMAGSAYQTTRAKVNWFPTPDGWIEYFHVPNNPDYPQFTGADGFEAIAFQNMANTNEIVISYAGTGTAIDWAANIGLATGVGSDQLRQAAEYYLQVKAANPGATITFTGHSLGGGLAALMGVFFGKQAITFDQAPFATSAISGQPDVAANLKAYLSAKLDASGNRIYDDTALSGLSSYIQLRQANGGIPNSGLVTDINVKGEVLSEAPVTLFNRIGTQTDLDNSTSGVSGTNLHSQALLTAFLQSSQSATNGGNSQQTLSKVTTKLTDLLGMIFDEKLFYHDPSDKDKPTPNFLERLVQHEAGVQGSLAADAMVTRFTDDLWQLAQDGGLTMNDGNLGNPDLHQVSNALIAFAMQKYYEEKDTSAGYNKALFTKLDTGGLQFDMADVSKTFQIAFDAHEELKLEEAKGFPPARIFY